MRATALVALIFLFIFNKGLTSFVIHGIVLV